MRSKWKVRACLAADLEAKWLHVTAPRTGDETFVGTGSAGAWPCCSPPGRPGYCDRTKSRVDHADRSLVARGEPLYQQHCASCHGARLEGQPEWQSRNAQGRLPAPPHDDSGHTWHHDDDVLFEVTKFGIAKHAPPGYQSGHAGIREDDE